jgi:hypothetical protein
MKKDQTGETVVLHDQDEWLEFVENEGGAALQVAAEFAGKRLIMTERIKQRMIDGLRADGSDDLSRVQLEEMMSETLAEFGVEVIADA